MPRGQMLNEDEGHPRVAGKMPEELFEGLQPTRGGADTDDREVLLFIFQRGTLSQGGGYRKRGMRTIREDLISF